MTDSVALQTRSVVIVGGGASGVIMATHLLRAGGPDLRVTVVEKRGRIGRGVAYGTDEPDHRLNVRATNMSALADEPNHFVEWLKGQGVASGDFAGVYAPRAAYGRYLEAALEEAKALGPASRLRIVRGTCTGLATHAASVEAALSDGSTLVAQAAVLATGHEENPSGERPFAMRFGADQGSPLDRQAPVLIMGTGLSMADTWLSLRQRGHQGPITAVSRRGLFPARHRRNVPIKLDRADIPFGTDLTYFLRWFRGLVRETESRGGDWRDVVDGLRPFNQQIWRNWPGGARRRFFEHTKAWWDVHRHRMAPEIHRRVLDAIASGSIRLVAGRVIGAAAQGEGWRATLQHRRTKQTEALYAARIYDCSGILSDPSKGTNPAILSLVAAGMARPDPLGIGLDVAADCAVLDASGRPSRRLFAVGPLTRGAFLEIDAVPDIRMQCARLARHILGSGSLPVAEAAAIPGQFRGVPPSP
jgi:uncharacterized NAD(P)/FAD-binding protein YdhS